MTAAQFEDAFPDEEACKVYLVARRWPNGVRCARCKSSHVYALKTMAFKWECMECGEGISYRFSHLAGTIFENTNKPLRDWFRVTYLMLTSKNRVSALQIMRFMGFGSYKTAWSMCHKIRAALIEPAIKLGGIVEVDETFIGGKAINKHGGVSGVKGGTRGKTPIIRAVSRKGNVIARVLPRHP
jgi:transposase-like protein